MAVKKESNFSLYDKAVEQVHNQQFEQALKTLGKCRHDYSDQIDLLARVDKFETLCRRRIRTPDSEKARTEELYSSGVLEHNRGNYGEALKFYDRALKQAKGNGAHIHLAIAASETLRGNKAKALEHLEKSVPGNERNRLLALNDPDFAQLAGEDAYKRLVQSHSR